MANGVYITDAAIVEGAEPAKGFFDQDGKRWFHHALPGLMHFRQSPRRQRKAGRQSKRLKGARSTIEFWYHNTDNSDTVPVVVQKKDARGRSSISIGSKKDG